MLEENAGSRIRRYYELLTRKPILVVENIWEAKCIGQIGMPKNLSLLGLKESQGLRVLESKYAYAVGGWRIAALEVGGEKPSESRKRVCRVQHLLSYRV